MKKILIVILFCPLFIFAQNQEFNIEQQYAQAMENAKQAFEAKQFSEAVMFYREAIKIKPDARLPKYKIEDIRTIYIEEELKNEAEPVLVSEPKRKKKKEIELEQVQAKQMAEQEATRKMNEDADNAVSDLKNLLVNVIEINEDADELGVDNSLQIEPVAKSELGSLKIRATEINEQDDDLLIENTAEIKPIEKDETAKLTIRTTRIDDDDEIEIQDTDKVETLEENEDAKLSIQVVDLNEESEEINDPVEIDLVKQTEIPEIKQKEKPKPKPQITYAPVQKKQMSVKEKEIWIKKENERLAEVYPNKKTVEEIEKPGKQITRVIMNIDNKITIYLKVKHSWGATYFFIDEVGQELRSINQQYFNLMTNIETYGG